MTIYEFARLGTNEKEFLVKNQGTILDEYTEKENKVLVYRFSSFIVEVEMSHAGVSIIPFTHN